MTLGPRAARAAVTGRRDAQLVAGGRLDVRSGIDRIFYVIYYVTGATFFIVQFTLLASLILYRHRDDRRATYTHGNTGLEIAWTIAPAILLVILAFVSRSVWASIKERVPPSDMQVQVTAKQ